jgi:squalene synthase HpnC
MPTKQANPKEVNALPVTHPENFPVASFLCPPHLRPAIAAIYAFARAADDIADEGDWPADERLRALMAFRHELADSNAQLPDLAPIFKPLHQVIEHYKLPVHLLDDLLKAFAQDIEATANGSTYPNMVALLSYCQLSANPVGRLLLHLYGVRDSLALQQSDAICSALQLINFWQDLSEDIPRGRFYLPQDLVHLETSDLIKTLCDHAFQMMHQGAPLVHKVPGRAGWELRLVVQGGLRILEKVKALGPRAMTQRPRLRTWDFPVMVWRALWMRPRQWENLKP